MSTNIKEDKEPDNNSGVAIESEADTTQSRGSGKGKKFLRNIKTNKKTFIYMAFLLLAAVVLGNYVVNKLVGGQEEGVGGFSSVNDDVSLNYDAQNNLVEQDYLSEEAFSHVKKDEELSVKAAQIDGESFFSKTIVSETDSSPFIAPIIPEEKKTSLITPDADIKNKTPSIFLTDPTVDNKYTGPIINNKPTRAFLQQEKRARDDYEAVMQSKLSEYQSLLDKTTEISDGSAGYFDFTEPEPETAVNNPDGSLVDGKPAILTALPTPLKTKKDINVGDVLYARLAFNLNTDFKTDVIAHVVSDDELSDAILIGSIEHNTQFDKMVLNFNSIQINGAVKPFKAIAIDIDSDLAGIADDVDNHYFQRFVMPILLGGVSTAADLFIKQGTSTTTPSTSDDVVSKTYTGGDKQIAAGMIQGGVDVLKTVFSKQSQRPITVLKNKKRLLKIIALSSI